MINNLKKSLILGIALIFAYLLSRLINLTLLPVFCDEAIYIRWAQVMRTVSSLRFLPLSDGKQPFFMWLVMPFLKFISDPLVAGRMVSVLAGLGTTIGIGVLVWILFKKKEVSFFASLFYLIVPFTLFFDRMALADGLLSALGVWYLVLIVSLAKKLRLDLAMLAGIVLGLGLITKSPALFFALMLPLVLIIFDFKVGLKQPGKLKIYLSLVFCFLVILFFALAIYSILRLGPEFHMIALRNKDYIFTFSDILKHPFNPLINNFKSIALWYFILLTPPVFFLGLMGIFLLLKTNFKKGIFLSFWWFLPLFAQSAIAKVFTARYVLFSVPIFLIFSAYAVESFWQRTKNKTLVVLGLSIIFFWPMYQSFMLLASPQNAWLPKDERKGYLEIWTSGYGIKETADYLKEIAKTQKVLVGTEGFFGTLPDGLQMYLEGVPNITVIGIGQPVTEISPKLISGLSDSRVFLLVNDSRLKIEKDSRLKLVSQHPKAGQENLLLLEIVN